MTELGNLMVEVCILKNNGPSSANKQSLALLANLGLQYHEGIQALIVGGWVVN